MAQENYIRAEFTSALFRFVDDVEFYFPEDQAANLGINKNDSKRLEL